MTTGWIKSNLPKAEQNSAWIMEELTKQNEWLEEEIRGIKDKLTKERYKSINKDESTECNDYLGNLMFMLNLEKKLAVYESEYQQFKLRTERINDDYLKKLEAELLEKEKKLKNLLIINDKLSKGYSETNFEEKFDREIKNELENKKYYLKQIESLSENLKRIVRVKK